MKMKVTAAFLAAFAALLQPVAAQQDASVGESANSNVPAQSPAASDHGHACNNQHSCAPINLERLLPIQRSILKQLAQISFPDEMRPAVCFAPDTPKEVIDAYNLLNTREDLALFRLGNRWTATATDGSGLAVGKPITLTWSIVPDGTSIPGSVGEPTSPSSLRAFLNGIYGSQAVWQAIFQQVFDRWSQFSAIKFVFEPNDDGAPFPSSPGALNVRGDIRISGHLVDGNSGILAYNFFPNNGDMVIDTGDVVFYNNVTNGSLNLRNVFAHEVGHGLGFQHVCPINETKLMEPFATTKLNGPQHDDILAVQRAYGDRFESNDTSATATDLGALATGATTVKDISIDRTADVDFYRFTVGTGPKKASVTLRPVGFIYLEGPQNPNGSCSSGVATNSLIINDLGVELLGTNGTTVLASANLVPAGQNETLVDVNLPDGAGPYFVRVFGGSANSVQLYDLDVVISDAQALTGLAINDSSVFEGDSGITNMVFNVTLTPANMQTVTVDFTTVDGLAVAGSDYVSTNGTLTFNPGVTNLSLIVGVIGDTIAEPNENFLVNLSNPSNASIAKSQGTGTIIDDDGGQFSDLIVTRNTDALALATKVTAGGSAGLIVKGATLISHTNAIGAASSGVYDLIGVPPHTYNLTLPGIVLSSGDVLDYQSGPNTSSGNTTAYGVAATTAQEALLDPITGGGTNNFNHFDATQLDIVFDVAPGSNQVTFLVVFGSEEFPEFVNSSFIDGFGIFLNGTNIAFSSGLPVNINHPDMAAIPGTELDGVIAPTNIAVLKFSALVAPGSINNTLTFIVSDTTDSVLDTTVYVSALQAVAPPPLPPLFVNDATVIEGNSGTTNMVFDIFLSQVSTQAVTVSFTTANGAASSGSDYVKTNGSLTFPAGVTNLTLAITVNGDTLNEANENFFLNLFNPVNASIAKGQGVGTIINDDPVTAVLSISDVTVVEGNSGTTNAIFTVNLSEPSGQVVTVRFATAVGTASAGSDYIPNSGTLIFPAGVTSRTITVSVRGDTAHEANETFSVNLTAPANALLGKSQGIGTILNDDLPPAVSISDDAIPEGDPAPGLVSNAIIFPPTNAFFAVTLSKPSGLPVSIDYATADGTATVGDNDYIAASGTLVFPPGVTNLVISVAIVPDTQDEPNETFFVNLSNPTNATLARTQATGTILNDDGAVLSIDDVTVAEGDSGTTNAVFNVNVSRASTNTITVKYSTQDRTATLADNDYLPAADTLTFPPGVTNRTISVAVNGDVKLEPSEFFIVKLSNPTNATISKDEGNGTIKDDDTIADLVVNITASPNPGFVGHHLTFNIGVTNNGTNAANGVVLSNLLPADVTLVLFNSSQGSCTNLGNNVVCNFGSLANGAGATATVTVIPTQAGVITNLAAVSASEPDPNEANNTAALAVTILNPVVTVVKAGATLTAENFSPANAAIDPNETVTMAFFLRNDGNVSNTNLVATLLPTGGINMPTGPQAYGALAPGGPAVSRLFSFTAGSVQTLVATFVLRDVTPVTTNELGAVQFVFSLGGTNSFSNGAPIMIPAIGQAAPYPSTIVVSGLTGVVNKVTVSLDNLSHEFGADLDVLLVSPWGEKVLLMSDAGGADPISNATVVFDDAAANFLPSASAVVSGTFKPTNIGNGDLFPAPAPGGPYANTMAAFKGIDPNGTWSLFVVDDGNGDQGAINGGWRLNIQTVEPVNPTVNLSLLLTAAPEPVFVGSNLVYSITVMNTGPGTATGVMVSNNLPDSVALLSAPAGSVANGNSVVSMLGNLAVGGQTNIALVVRPTAPGSITNWASLKAVETDLFPDDNLASVVSQVNRIIALQLGADGGFTNSHFVFTLIGQGGLTYVIEVSTNLVHWIPISTNSTFDGIIKITDTNILNFDFQFYRALER